MAFLAGLLVLLLFIRSLLTRSQEIKYIAVSSNLTLNFGDCKPNMLYSIYHGDVPIYSFCEYTQQIPDTFEGRIKVNESLGCVTLVNVTKSDDGYYKLERTSANGKKELLLEAEVRILDEAWINELYRNNTEETISLTVGCAGEAYSINWTMDGGGLSDRHLLSDDNRTLTIPYNVTGMITVHVSNLASADNKYIALIKDLNEITNNSGPIMYWNINRVIWREGGGQADNHILILSRNVTNISVITLSESTGDDQFDSGWWGLLIIVISVILLVVAVLVCKKKRNANVL
ncbi:uncharacterized protein LOC130295087 isoform X2 [Hyla sarda]|uniref:uncharacterized protein LOC130295087 isoform X2 n=1 Tax=Hyla sarda TaxID=327740 RepID=UPI0024C3F8D9|nr:uncharacterized protein LOC130295087 isoform X2 [Hyla sarda]